MTGKPYWKKLEFGVVENGRFKAGANDLTDFPSIAREMIFRACDLEARFDLMDRYEREYDAGNKKARACSSTPKCISKIGAPTSSTRPHLRPPSRSNSYSQRKRRPSSEPPPRCR